jgi:hypothetical protein
MFVNVCVESASKCKAMQRYRKMGIKMPSSFVPKYLPEG